MVISFGLDTQRLSRGIEGKQEQQLGREWALFGWEAQFTETSERLRFESKQNIRTTSGPASAIQRTSNDISHSDRFCQITLQSVELFVPLFSKWRRQSWR